MTTIHIHLASKRTKDAYRGAWTEHVDETELKDFKVGATVTRKGVKAQVKEKGVQPAKKTASGEMIPAQGFVKFETVDAVKDSIASAEKAIAQQQRLIDGCIKNGRTVAPVLQQRLAFLKEELDKEKAKAERDAGE